MTHMQGSPFGPRYYEEHAAGLGWGPDSAPDAFKLAHLGLEQRELEEIGRAHV